MLNVLTEDTAVYDAIHAQEFEVSKRLIEMMQEPDVQDFLRSVVFKEYLLEQKVDYKAKVNMARDVEFIEKFKKIRGRAPLHQPKNPLPMIKQLRRSMSLDETGGAFNDMSLKSSGDHFKTYD